MAFFEMSFLLPHFLKEGRGKLAMYFTRVYNPVWTNPDGMSWIEMLTTKAKSSVMHVSPRPGARPLCLPIMSCRWAMPRSGMI